jgi:CubicO group peptidase (beta-lactamase class C family)
MEQTRRTVLKRAALALAAIARPAGAAPKDLPSPQESAALRDNAEAFRKAHSLPGLSVAIAQDGELVYEQGFGMADEAAREPITPRSLFRIASVSKPITSVTIFDLIEKGSLKLDDLVFGPQGILGEAYGGPPYKKYVGEIRLHHLLTHTGGGWTNDGTDPMFQHSRMNHQQLITWAIANVPLTHPPGEHFAYSNFGYCVLGRVIEKVSRRPYEAHVREAILSRCGVTDMRIGGNTLAERVPGEVVYYDPSESPYSMNVRRMDSHGGWLATASDLVRFATHVDGFPSVPDILKEDSIREMTTATTASAGYAKGWAVNPSHNWWHTGSLPGTATVMVRTNSRFCWAALTNTRRKGADLDGFMWTMVRQVKEWKA